MPWKETCSMNEKIRFVMEFESGDYPMAQLCRMYGISRQTGYKWWNRYAQSGSFDALEELPRVPQHNPRALSADLVQEVLQVRYMHRTWGARKILAWLDRHRPGLELCSASAVNDILKRHGLIVPRKKRARTPASPIVAAAHMQPNDLWCADFKGWFLCGNGEKCTPLTITDAATRFIIKLQSVDGLANSDALIALFDAAFDQYGLPLRIRTDNGPPFASTGLGGLTALNVHWLELGIALERSRPAHPQDNGRHERMHRTLKEDTASPPQATLRLQQMLFDDWRDGFNYYRPHEALDLCPPGDFYEPSPRLLPSRKVQWVYDDTIDDRRRVRPSGQIKWCGRDVRVSSSLVGRDVGLRRLNDRYWEVTFRDIILGYLDTREMKIVRPNARMLKILKSIEE